MSAELPSLGPRAVLAVIDVQRLFAEDTGWRVAGLPGIVPNVLRLARRPERAILTRFIPPPSADHAPPAWRPFYRRWAGIVDLPPEMHDLIRPIAALSPPAEVCDKTTFSAFESGPFAASLRRREADTLVLAGVETDACVYATAMSAIDRNFRVVVAADAVASGSTAAHAAVLGETLTRLSPTVLVASTDEILAAWD